MIIKPDIFKSFTASERSCFNSIEKLGPKILKLNLIELAALANVSTATIKRTLNKLGYESLKDLKKDIDLKNDQITPTTIKESNNFEAALLDLLLNYDQVKINNATALIEQAQTIYIVGFGSTTSLAFDFSLHLRKFAINSIYINDSEMLEIINYSSDNPKDLIIYVSYSASDTDMTMMSDLQKNKKKQMLITSKSNTELEKNCDIILNTHTYHLDSFLKSRIPMGIIQMKILLRLANQKN